MVLGKALYISLLLPLMFAAKDFDECWALITTATIDFACAPLFLSKFLGYGIVGGSLFLKFPQIWKIYQSKSVAGLSEASFYLELLNYTMITAYSMHNLQPFSTYGESAIISVQCVVQCFMLWTYGKSTLQHQLSVGTFFVVGWCFPLFAELWPENLWVLVPLSSTIMNIVVRGSQLWTNYQNKSTGQLALITCLLNLLGTIARVFTTIMELADPFMLMTYVVATALNGTIVLQFYLYWNSEIGKEKEAEKTK